MNYFLCDLILTFLRSRWIVCKNRSIAIIYLSKVIVKRNFLLPSLAYCRWYIRCHFAQGISLANLARN